MRAGEHPIPQLQIIRMIFARQAQRCARALRRTAGQANSPKPTLRLDLFLLAGKNGGG
jgi:hypothetical protein